jgi:hypothetical protein
MSIPGSASPLFFQTAAADAAAAGPIKSVRFNKADSPYLNRTMSGGDRGKATISCWLKKCNVHSVTSEYIYLMGVSSECSVYISSNDKLRFDFYHTDGSTWAVIANSDMVFRDVSAWYHIVLSIDSSAGTSNADRVKLYVNGAQQTFTFTTYGTGTITGDIKHLNESGQTFQINSRPGKSYYGNFYLANYHYIDGQALDPTDFGAFDDNGVWQAAEYSGTFGTNGFHLFDFANESGIGNDSSGNDNDFTVNNLTSEGGSKIRTTELSVNHASGVISLPGNAFDSTYISARINTSTFAVTNTAWLGSYANGYAEARWIPVGGYAVTSSLRVYFGVYSNAAASSTLTVTYTDTTTESSSQFTSGNNNWMTLFTASNAAGKTIQKIEISNPSTTNVQFGGFVIDDQIVETANADTDVLRDVPTNGNSSDDTGAGGEVSGNYATWNPLTSRGVVTTSQGNLTANAVNSGYGYTLSTIPVSSGKYYCEISFEGTMAHSVNYNYIGIVPTDSAAIYTGQDIFRADGALSIDSNGSVIRGNIGNGSNDTNNTYQSSYGFDENDTIGIAIDCDTPQVTFYKNGTSIGTFPHTMQSNKSWVLFINDWANAADFTGYVLNTGQKAFEDSAPSGFKALCTTNLPTPTIANGRDHFDTKLYTGNGGSSTIAVSGYNFAPNLVWLKGRSDPDKHGLYDTVRGATKLLIPSSANGESTQNGVTAFNSDGFDIGDYAETNGNNRTYVAWAWNIPGSASSNSDGTITSSVTKNVDAGISIVTWTGDDSTGTIGHGLGSKPDLIVAKVYGDSSYSDNWPVYSSVFDGTHYAYLNDTRKFTDFAGFWNDGTATSTVFPVGDYNTDNTKSLLALCFTSVAGFSSIGSYEGNGSTTAGVFVYMDFRPAWILVKRADTSSSYGSWAIYDSTRSTFNTTGTSSYNFPLWANRDAQEGKRGNGSDAASGFENIVNFFSNGFMALGAGAELNVANETYVYMAFASNPFSANGGLAF